MGFLKRRRTRSTLPSFLIVMIALILLLTLAGRSHGHATPVSAQTACATASVQTGWNLVGGPAGTVFKGAQALFTYQAPDTAYESLPPATVFNGGIGAWAYFSSPATISLPQAPTALPILITLPAGHFVMVGNPGCTTATVSGADEVVTFSPSTNGYTSTTTLSPGQGAWAVSVKGGTLTISNAATSAGSVR